MRVFSNNIHGKLHISPICKLEKYNKKTWKKIKTVKMIAASCLDYQLRTRAYKNQGFRVSIEFMEGTLFLRT